MHICAADAAVTPAAVAAVGLRPSFGSGPVLGVSWGECEGSE